MKLPFADLIAFQRNALEFFLSRGSKARRPLEKLAMGPSRVYLATEPSIVKQILRAPESDFDKGKLVQKLRAVLGQSSMTMSGEAHRERRTVLHAQLARGIATNYVPQIEAIMAQTVAEIVRMGGEFLAHEITAPLSLRVISTILFGAGALTPGDEAVLINAINLIEEELADEFFRLLPSPPWTAQKRHKKFREGRSMIGHVVSRVRERAPFASILCGLKALELSEQDLIDEVMLVILAGHHTTGTSAAWLLYHLACEPELRVRIAEEAATISTPAGEIDPACLSRATLSQALVRETLRLYPASWWMSREVMRPLELAGQRLPTGASVLISPWQMHRDARFWDDPERFDVNRPSGNAAFMPFGLGPRACVGMGLALLELQILALTFASALSFERPVTAHLPTPSITLLPPAIRLRARPGADQIFPAADVAA